MQVAGRRVDHRVDHRRRRPVAGQRVAHVAVINPDAVRGIAKRMIGRAIKRRFQRLRIGRRSYRNCRIPARLRREFFNYTF